MEFPDACPLVRVEFGSLGAVEAVISHERFRPLGFLYFILFFTSCNHDYRAGLNFNPVIQCRNICSQPMPWKRELDRAVASCSG